MVVCEATTRPVCTLTEVAMWVRRRRWDRRSTAIIPLAGTTRLWKAFGCSTPSLVVKVRLAMAGLGYGLSSVTTSRSLMRVAPVGKYQLVAPAVAQGSETVPSGPASRCSTVAAPPSISTVAPTQGVPWGTVSATVARRSGATVTVSVLERPWLATRWMSAVTGRWPTLVISRLPGAGDLAWSVAPAQNHEDDRASVGATCGPAGRETVAMVGAALDPSLARPWRPAMMPTTRTAATTATTGSRRVVTDRRWDRPARRWAATSAARRDGDRRLARPGPPGPAPPGPPPPGPPPPGPVPPGPVPPAPVPP